MSLRESNRRSRRAGGGGAAAAKARAGGSGGGGTAEELADDLFVVKLTGSARRGIKEAQYQLGLLHEKGRRAGGFCNQDVCAERLPASGSLHQESLSAPFLFGMGGGRPGGARPGGGGGDGCLVVGRGRRGTSRGRGAWAWRVGTQRSPCGGM